MRGSNPGASVHICTSKSTRGRIVCCHQATELTYTVPDSSGLGSCKTKERARGLKIPNKLLTWTTCSPSSPRDEKTTVWAARAPNNLEDLQVATRRRRWSTKPGKHQQQLAHAHLEG